MKRLVVSEHTRLERRDGTVPDGGGQVCLDGRRYDRLHAFDRIGRSQDDRVFEWGDGFARATQWVGVVQVPGLQVEILPKIDALTEGLAPETEAARYEARRNLLYMLSVSGDVPVRSRDVARLAVRQAPLSETLAAIFADRLRRELLRGPVRAYLELEEDLRLFKGKLVVARQVVLNSARRDRFYCRYDEFSGDTLLNRVLKASCGVLLDVTRMPGTQDALRHCLLLLDDVADAEIQDADFDRIALNRQNERFEDVLRFCRLLLSGRTPNVRAGATRTFSLLFDMNKVFERFVAAYLRRFVVPALADVQLFPQALRHKRHLMQSGGKGVLQLQPDLLLESPLGRVVMDTKWKLLSPGNRGRGGVAESDLYQLYAYTKRFGCTRSVLLYPSVPGLETRDFEVLDAGGQLSGERVMVRHVGLHRNLHVDSERVALTSELRTIVLEGLGIDRPVHVGPTSIESAA